MANSSGLVQIETKGTFKRGNKEPSWRTSFEIGDNHDTIRLFFNPTQQLEEKQFFLFPSRGIQGTERDGKLSCVSFLKDSGLACHLFDSTDMIDGRVPMVLHGTYDSDKDTLIVYFVPNDLYEKGNFRNKYSSSHQRYKCDVSLDLDKALGIMAIEFTCASRILNMWP